MDSKSQKLEDVLHHEIPLSRHIGIQVAELTGESLTLKAPLQPNINHKLTAFGGSLYSVAVLSGWGLLYLKLEEQGLHGHIVIHESEVKYHKPVKGDIVACARLQENAAWERFLKLYHRAGRARIEVESDIIFNDEIALGFRGIYVVHQ